MSKNVNYVSHKKSKQKNQDGSPKLPVASALVEGEIAINFAENVETLSILNESGNVVTFSSDNYYSEKKLGSAFTGANSAVTVTEAIEELEEVVSSSLNDLNSRKMDSSAYTEIWESGTGESSAVLKGSSGTASGDYSVAEGGQTSATSLYSHAEGYMTLASNVGTHTEGQSTSATSIFSHAEGLATLASGVYSHAEGQNTTASGFYSHTEGLATLANNSSAHAEGYMTLASGSQSHAEGQSTSATSTSTHAEGNMTLASGSYSHAEGASSIASGYTSHAEGDMTLASGNYSHAEGSMSKANGTTSHAEGSSTIANGSSSHAEGSSTIANGSSSHAEGVTTKAIGDYSHAEGDSTSATSQNSHTEGMSTIAKGGSAHAEGAFTKAIGNYSHAEGYQSESVGYFSHVEGQSTIANNFSEHASGQYNVSSSGSSTFGNSGNTLFSVGNGTASNARHNAFEIRQNGDIYIVNKDGDDVRLQDEIGNIDVDQVLDDTTSASTNPVSSKAVYKAVTDNELVWTNAFVVISGAVSSHTHVSSAITSMDGYSKPSTTSAISTGDTLNAAIGKLEKAIDGIQPSGNYVTTDTNQTITGLKTFGVSGISFTQNSNNDGGDIYKGLDGEISINNVKFFDYGNSGREINLGADGSIYGESGSCVSVSNIYFGEIPGDYSLTGDYPITINGETVNYTGILYTGDEVFMAPDNLVIGQSGDFPAPVMAYYASGLKTYSGTSDDLLTADGYSYSKTLLQNVPEERPNGNTWSGSMDFNYYYNFGYRTSISITSFVTPTAINGVYPHAEYKFSFYSPSTATTLSFPASVTIFWAKGESPTIEASTMYEFSIVYNSGAYLGMWTSWPNIV